MGGVVIRIVYRGLPCYFGFMSRRDSEMLELILTAARTDPRVRAVILNGSRANPAAPRDFFQDFDIVYVVTELESFLADPGWFDRIGAGIPDTWTALFDICRLFRTAARQVAGRYQLTYPESDDARVSAHLRHVHDLPRTAGNMYPEGGIS